MTKIALLGAGGKMGVRLASNLKGSPYEVAHVEVSEEGRQRLKTVVGADCVDRDTALRDADVVIMAVPDRLIGKIAHSFIDIVKPGTAVIMLDAAAPYAGELPARADVTYFVTHPCHPPIFNDETDPAAKNDFFGGVNAKQHIVCALMQGPEEHYALCEDIARTIYKPVMRSHRCTVEHIAIMERRGVPRQAAIDFMLGHLNIELAIAFEVFPEGKFSDGALYAIDQARPQIFREGWLERIFDPVAVKRSVTEICNPPKAA